MSEMQVSVTHVQITVDFRIYHTGLSAFNFGNYQRVPNAISNVQEEEATKINKEEKRK
jgi:uncharacterized ubiquitin-like protein YukD